MNRRISPGWLAALLLLPAEAVAQSTSVVAPSLVTPQSFRPKSLPDNFVIATPKAGFQAQVQGGDLSVLLGAVTIEGGHPDLVSAEKSVRAELGAARVTINEIHAKVDALEKAYVAEGFVLVRVVVPPQKLSNGGPLRIVVIDGYLEDIDLRGVPDRVRPVVEARVAGIVGKKGLRLGELERAVLIAGATAGLDLKSTLARGDQDGGTKLILEGSHKLVKIYTSSDNRIPGSLGSVQHSVSASLNSALGFGEQVYATAGFGNDPGDQWRGKAPLGMIASGVVVPLGVTGLTINPEFTLSKTYPNPTVGAPQSRGSFQRVATRLEYPLVQTHAFVLKAKGGVEFIQQTQELPDFGIHLSRDVYSVARGGFDVFASSVFGVPTSGSVTFSHGINGREAVTGVTPLTRAGADPDFAKLNGSIKVSQNIFENLRLVVAAGAQYGFSKPMFSSEQFALDGPEAVSGYASGSFAVDEGVTLRTELVQSYALSFGERASVLSPYIFAATGTGRIMAPTAVERGTRTAVSGGAGLRFNLDPGLILPGLVGSTEIARAHSDDALHNNVWRVTAALGLVF